MYQLEKLEEDQAKREQPTEQRDGEEVGTDGGVGGGFWGDVCGWSVAVTQEGRTSHLKLISTEDTEIMTSVFLSRVSR